MNILKVRFTLTEELLGTKAANREVFASYIASKAPDGDKRREELDTAEHREEAGTTIFHRAPNGQLILWDYQVKGFLKEAADILRQSEEEPTEEPMVEGDDAPKKKVRKKWGSARSKMDNFVFVFPRMIPLGVTESGAVCERPLRAQTMQGPRVSLARSETVPAGASFVAEIRILPGAPITEAMVLQCLEYGALKGLGQWRNSGKGRFSYEVLK